jgi:hypothetical protein
MRKRKNGKPLKRSSSSYKKKKHLNLSNKTLKKRQMGGGFMDLFKGKKSNVERKPLLHSTVNDPILHDNANVQPPTPFINDANYVKSPLHVNTEHGENTATPINVVPSSSTVVPSTVVPSTVVPSTVVPSSEELSDVKEDKVPTVPISREEEQEKIFPSEGTPIHDVPNTEYDVNDVHLEQEQEQKEQEQEQERQQKEEEQEREQQRQQKEEEQERQKEQEVREQEQQRQQKEQEVREQEQQRQQKEEEQQRQQKEQEEQREQKEREQKEQERQQKEQEDQEQDQHQDQKEEEQEHTFPSEGATIHETSAKDTFPEVSTLTSENQYSENPPSEEEIIPFPYSNNEPGSESVSNMSEPISTSFENIMDYFSNQIVNKLSNVFKMQNEKKHLQNPFISNNINNRTIGSNSQQGGKSRKQSKQSKKYTRKYT